MRLSTARGEGVRRRDERAAGAPGEVGAAPAGGLVDEPGGPDPRLLAAQDLDRAQASSELLDLNTNQFMVWSHKK